jgi:hypothetical protein
LLESGAWSSSSVLEWLIVVSEKGETKRSCCRIAPQTYNNLFNKPKMICCRFTIVFYNEKWG